MSNGGPRLATGSNLEHEPVSAADAETSWMRTRQGTKSTVRPIRNRPKDPLDHEPAAVTYARAQAGLTKTQLAEVCNVSLSLISEIEAGTRNATPAMIGKIAQALNCPRVVLERKHK